VTTSLVGRKLGSYEIVALLGQGGMATVYKGYRGDIDRYVAVKVLPPHPGLDQQFIDRFKLEARTIARLEHPHILPLYDYGVEDDILYLVMAFIEGGSLANRIDQGPLPLPEIDRLLRQLASALDYAHRQGVIHRDIKPDNILLDKEGNALLADFGIVKISQSGDTLPALTVTGGLVGTPAYMAPEQGSGSSNVTNGADLYSLGVVVYEMLTGQQPYTADTPMQVVIKHINAPVPNPRDVNENLNTAIVTVMQRILAKEPGERYRTATEFADDFRRAIQGSDVFAAGPVFIPADAAAPLGTSTNPLVTPTQLPYPTQPQNPANPTPPQTIIVQPGTNPLLLLGGFAIIAVLLVVVVLVVTGGNRGADTPAATLPPTAQPTTVAAAVTAAPTFGTLSFGQTDQPGDTVTLQVQNLKPPAADQQYVVWLLNTTDDSTLKIGELTLNALGSGAMNAYTDPESRVLPALYNAVAISLEPKASMGDTPAGAVAYSAAVPARVMQTLTAIFITAPEGILESALGGGIYDSVDDDGDGPHTGLLRSALAEADRARQHAGLAQSAGTIGGMHSHNEHTLNIMNGELVDYAGDGTPENPGFLKGVSYYLDLMQTELLEAANAPGATIRLQSNIEFVRICLDNSRQRITAIAEHEQQMLAETTDVANVAEVALQSTQLAAALLNGVDANGNGQVDPFEGECGLEQIKTFGPLISTMQLSEGPLPE